MSFYLPYLGWPPAGVTTKNRSGGPLIRRIMSMLQQQYPAHRLSCWVSSADGDSMPSESRQLSPAWLRVFPWVGGGIGCTGLHRQPEGGPAVGLDLPETGVPVRSFSVSVWWALWGARAGARDGGGCFACVWDSSRFAHQRLFRCCGIRSIRILEGRYRHLSDDG